MSEEEYLLEYHKDEIRRILSDTNSNKHYSIYINFIILFGNCPKLGNLLLKKPDVALDNWNNALIKVQHQLVASDQEEIKKIHCRLHCLSDFPELTRSVFPGNDDVGSFLEVSGTVVRVTETKLFEFERQYICAKCKYPMTVKADFEQKNTITPPRKCLNPEQCKSFNIVSMGELDTDNCKDYQEIKIQEEVTKSGTDAFPGTMWVILEDDCVDICKPGDNVTICGVVRRRWEPLVLGKKIEVNIVFKANYIQVNNTYGSGSLKPETKTFFEEFWESYKQEPLLGRDIILKSICPQLFGLYFVKLATALVLAGGSKVENVSPTGVRIRSESHLLLVGDPGTGKSQLLRFASKIIPRSVLTTGIGSTAAGLTVTAIKENGEWQLEGGALVLADGGICCIDEFNSMKEHDRTSIHEAMEQQSISVAKASIVCKLSTKCSILAACNPKGNIDPNQPLSLNIALPSPLLSRFDLILLLRDTVNEEWDSLVCDYILNGGSNFSKLTENNIWNLKLLQDYFRTIKKINPKLTDESDMILSRYYQCQRRVDHRNKSRTTVRLLDSLIRLAQGHAKLMYHNTVQTIDAMFALILVDTAMETDGRILNLNLNTHSTFPENPTGEYLEILEIILTQLELVDLFEQERDRYIKHASSKGKKSRFFNSKSEELSDQIDADCSFITSTQMQHQVEKPNNETSKLDCSRIKENESINLETSILEPSTSKTNKNDVNIIKSSKKNPKQPKVPTYKPNESIDLETSILEPSTSKTGKKSSKKSPQVPQVPTLKTTAKTPNKPIETIVAEVSTSHCMMTDEPKPGPSKKFKFKKPVNDIDLLNCLPSVNDDIMNLGVNFDDDFELFDDFDESRNMEIEHCDSNQDQNIASTVGNPLNNITILKNEIIAPPALLETQNKKIPPQVDQIKPTVNRKNLKQLFGFQPRDKDKEDGNSNKGVPEKENIVNMVLPVKPVEKTNSQHLDALSQMSSIGIDDIDFNL